jgi:DNA mismatch endonuclease (patch repair protein)
MQAVKSKNTAIEMRVRQLLYAKGYRYRLHRSDLPGCPDLVFSSRKKVIFVHGCFWHGHQCARGKRVPKTNTGYWTGKILRNATRDAATREQFLELGWKVSIVWECDIARDSRAVLNKLSRFLGKP